MARTKQTARKVSRDPHRSLAYKPPRPFPPPPPRRRSVRRLEQETRSLEMEISELQKKVEYHHFMATVLSVWFSKDGDVLGDGLRHLEDRDLHLDVVRACAPLIQKFYEEAERHREQRDVFLRRLEGLGVHHILFELDDDGRNHPESDDSSGWPSQTPSDSE